MMEDIGLFLFQIVFWVGSATICAFIANSKGRSGVAWFFIGFLMSLPFLGLIAILIISVISNVKMDENYRKKNRDDKRRLREQLRQERMKNEVFRQHTAKRLDAHDNVMGIDTKNTEALPDVAPPPVLIGEQQLKEIDWYYILEGETLGPVPENKLKDLLRLEKIELSTLVCPVGDQEWQNISKYPQLQI